MVFLKHIANLTIFFHFSNFNHLEFIIPGKTNGAVPESAQPRIVIGQISLTVVSVHTVSHG